MDIVNNEKIIQNNIILRPITKKDSDLIILWRNKESVKKNFIYREDLTIETHIKWLEEKVFTGKVIQFIIEIKNKNEIIPIGSVYLRDIDNINSSAEFGIFIGEDSVRGKGIGTSVAQILLEYAHNKLKLHRIFLRLIADNIPAYKSYRKAGFVTEGIFRDMIKIDNKYIDVIFMSSIKNSEKS